MPGCVAEPGVMSVLDHATGILALIGCVASVWLFFAWKRAKETAAERIGALEFELLTSAKEKNKEIERLKKLERYMTDALRDRSEKWVEAIRAAGVPKETIDRIAAKWFHGVLNPNQAGGAAPGAVRNGGSSGGGPDRGGGTT